MRSLERRLLIGIAMSVLAVFVLVLIGGTVAVRELNEAYVYTRLGSDTEALLAAVRPSRRDGTVGLRERRLSPVYTQPFSGHYFVILGLGDEPITSRSLWDETLDVEMLQPGATRRERTSGPNGQTLLLAASGFRRDELNLTIAVAEDVSRLADSIRRYQLLSAGAFLIVLLLLLLTQRRIVRIAIRQLDKLRDDVRRIGRGQQDALRDNVPTEVQPLVSEFNRLLQLLNQRIERSRNAVGNLAHALKTPLSLIISELERNERPDAMLTRRELERIRQLVDRELRRARIAGGGLPGRRFNAATDVPALLNSLRKLHRGKTLDLRVNGIPEYPLPVDREDMLELLGNLLDNAFKWARARVELTFALRPGKISCTVEDDGPGVADKDLDQIAVRGTRMDEETDGHGLGLSIVSDIVKVYEGRIEYSRSKLLNGLSVEIEMIGPDLSDHA